MVNTASRAGAGWREGSTRLEVLVDCVLFAMVFGSPLSRPWWCRFITFVIMWRLADILP